MESYPSARRSQYPLSIYISHNPQEQHQYQSLVLLADALGAVARRLSLPYRHHTHLLDLFYHTTIQAQKVSVPSMTYFDKR